MAEESSSLASPFKVGKMVRLKAEGLHLTERQRAIYRLQHANIFRIRKIEERRFRTREKEHQKNCQRLFPDCRCDWAYDVHYYLQLEHSDTWVPATYFEIMSF